MITVRPLSTGLAERARVELGETPDVLKAGIQQLRDWIHSQPHLRARTDDQWLAAFLRGSKHRLDQAQAKIDLYYSLRNIAPELQKLKYNDPKVGEILERGTIVILPTPRNQERITITRLSTYDPKEYTVFDVITVYKLVSQINLMEDDNFTVAGVINIIDLRSSKFGHYLQTSPRQLRNIIYTNQDAFPARTKEVHFIGAPSIFIALMRFIKRFLSDKIKDRIHMHNDVDTLYHHIPRDLLPAEYGGTASSIREINETWKQKVVDYYNFFEDDLQYGTDESLRVKEGWWGKKVNKD